MGIINNDAKRLFLNVFQPPGNAGEVGQRFSDNFFFYPPRSRESGGGGGVFAVKIAL